jgi:hypothetical protein
MLKYNIMCKGLQDGGRGIFQYSLSEINVRELRKETLKPRIPPLLK